MNDVFLEFNGIIDEEIKAYESLGELYKLKQSIIVQGKGDVLWDIDSQIIERAKNIQSLNQKRKEVAKYLGNENITMTEIIKKAQEANSDFTEKLEAQKVKLNILSKTLTLQEQTNKELVKHGLTMIRKTLDIIVGVILPQNNGQYDKNGQNITAKSNFISSIEEEV